MTAKEHYDNHLGRLYSWMAGDFKIKKEEFKRFLIDNRITPKTNQIAIDLGAGNGMQSIPLAELGFKVLAVDFNQHLLDELKANAYGLPVDVKIEDIRNIRHLVSGHAELIICCGDTLTHLDSKQQIETFISDISSSLGSNGKVILSFSDYLTALTVINRFIPVKSDETKILTCVLDYEDEFVNVSDLLHEKTDNGWSQKVSRYKKVRIGADEIVKCLVTNGLSIEFTDTINRMKTIIAKKH